MLNIHGKEFPGKDKSRNKVVRSEQVQLLVLEGVGKGGGDGLNNQKKQ